MIVKYDEEAIRRAMSLLNGLEVKGIENARIVAVIAQILNNPKEDDHGTESSKTEQN